MKKLNTLFYVIGTICFMIAIYIIYDKYFAKDIINVNFNSTEEINVLNDKLSEIGSSLGWIVIVDGINNQDNTGKYNVSYGENLLDNYNYKQLFTMEYILSYSSNYDKFIVLDMTGNKIDDLPTSDFTTAYIKFEDFNYYYELLFGEKFDNDRAMKGNTSYDGTYVYYDNRRAGSNGVYVSMIQANSVLYKDGEYSSDVTITYSTKASELVGVTQDTATIKYSKDINGNILFESFTLKDK